VPLRDDLRHSVRVLARAPWFAGALVVSAAIGIGVNAVVFGLIGRLLDPGEVLPGTADSSWLRRLDAIGLLMTFESVFVFVIAATSTIGLLLSRGAARVHETAVRTSLGAQSRELYRPLMAEGAVIGFIAIVVGLLATFWTVQALPAMFYAGDVDRLPFTVNWGNLLIATVLGCLVIFGGALTPMIWTSSRRPAPVRGAGSGLSNTFGRWRSGLTIVQLSLCAVMLLSSGSVIKRIENALRTDHAERIGTLTVARLERLGWTQPVIGALHKSFNGLSIEPVHVLPGGLAVSVPYHVLPAGRSYRRFGTQHHWWGTSGACWTHLDVW
jgi:hypothetical protein